MRFIPAGEFTMGSDNPHSMPNEHPARRVRVSGFWIDEHPVTNAEFARFVAATGYVTIAERAPEGEQIRSSHVDDRNAHPVVHVSWDDAAAYAK